MKREFTIYALFSAFSSQRSMLPTTLRSVNRMSTGDNDLASASNATVANPSLSRVKRENIVAFEERTIDSKRVKVVRLVRLFLKKIDSFSLVWNVSVFLAGLWQGNGQVYRDRVPGQGIEPIPTGGHPSPGSSVEQYFPRGGRCCFPSSFSMFWNNLSSNLVFFHVLIWLGLSGYRHDRDQIQGGSHGGHYLSSGGR